jgi:3',5'-nucleoside bisphosphate phosphatase
VLLARLRAAGVRAFSITDHDTVDALAEGAALARAHALEFVTGIEITAVVEGEDVHVLGYGFDPAAPELLAFLALQRAQRLARVRALGDRLTGLGLAIDVEPLCQSARRQPGRAIGRPQVADLLVAGGYVRNRGEAFDQWLKVGAPGFVPRQGPTPREVIEQIHGARGLACLAHPGKLQRSLDVARLPDLGLDGLEVFHPSHDPEDQVLLLALAAEHGYIVTGGSDYHGGAADDERAAFGTVALPPERYEAAMRRAAARGAPGIPARFAGV